MVKFTQDEKKLFWTAYDENGTPLYRYHVFNAERIIRSITVLNKHVTTFELPPFPMRPVDQEINEVLLPSLGHGPFNSRLMNKYINGSVKVGRNCFSGIKNATLVLPYNYSVALLGGCNAWEPGVFANKATLVVGPKMAQHKIEKLVSVVSSGKTQPVMEEDYTLIADKRLASVEEFLNETAKHKTEGVKYLYVIGKSKNFILNNSENLEQA